MLMLHRSLTKRLCGATPLLRPAAALGLAGALLVPLAACAEPGGAQPLGDQPLDTRAMEGLLTIEDIAEAGGDISRLHVDVEDVLTTAREINPDQQEGIVAWHAMKVKRGRSNATLIFAVQEFGSPDDARDRLSTVESGLGYHPMDNGIGDGAAKLSTSSGAGIMFVQSHRMVSIQATAGDAVEPILDEEGLDKLARIIASRL